jgi:hypothetical protein
MDNITKGLIAGVIFGIASIIPMMFMPIDEKPRAMVASFIDRFAIGFIIFNLSLPIAGWLKGGLVGLILSLPPAIVTKKYAPILGFGIIGGVVCGILS